MYYTIKQMTYTNFIHYARIILRCSLEFLPVLAFFVAYEYSKEDFYKATYSMIIMTMLYTLYTFHKYKRIPYLALFICLETALFGALTLAFRDPMYVQVRDTFYDLLLGSFMLGSAMLNKPIIKKFFGHIFVLQDFVWKSLSYKWGILLLTFGITNEIVRRLYDEHIWVGYKFAIMMITITFGLYQLWRYRKHVEN